MKAEATKRLADLASTFKLHHDQHNQAFARVKVGNHVENLMLRSESFKGCLSHLYYRKHREVPNGTALADAIALLEGNARYDSPREELFLRVARHDGNIIIDLGDSEWRVAKVTGAGWHILTDSPVCFFRTQSMQALPVPLADAGSLDPLWELLNVSKAQRPLIAGGLLSGLHPSGPYFVTNYIGEAGAAKSMAARFNRQLIDPSATPLRPPPRDERELLVQAGSNRVVVLDNVSSLPPWLSDALCRLATGGGYSGRRLYTDAEEFTFAIKRPVIMTGIEDVAHRPDLGDRALQIELEPIPERRRVPEAELLARFESVSGVIFAGLLDGLACALREFPTVPNEGLPRMADAAKFATAGETVFGWKRGTFLKAHRANLHEGAIESVESDCVAVGIVALMNRQAEWSGEPAELLKELTRHENDTRSRTWPQNPRALSSRLRRFAEPLRRSGIKVEFTRGKRRLICLRRKLGDGGPGDANDASVANILSLEKGEREEGGWIAEEWA